MTSSIYAELRRDLTNALGESQSENPWVEAGIALEIVRTRLEQHFASMEFGNEERFVGGDKYIQSLLAR